MEVGRRRGSGHSRRFPSIGFSEINEYDEVSLSINAVPQQLNASVGWVGHYLSRVTELKGVEKKPTFLN